MTEQATKIVVTPSQAELALGSTLQLSVELLNRQGESVDVDGSEANLPEFKHRTRTSQRNGVSHGKQPCSECLKHGWNCGGRSFIPIRREWKNLYLRFIGDYGTARVLRARCATQFRQGRLSTVR